MPIWDIGSLAERDVGRVLGYAWCGCWGLGFVSRSENGLAFETCILRSVFGARTDGRSGHSRRGRQLGVTRSYIERTRSLTVDRYVWRDRVCVGGMRIHFEQSVAGLYVVDESVEVTTNYSAVPSEFDNSDPTWRGCELWLEENSSRIELYGELGKVNYERLNSYYMVGQDVVLVVDAEDEPIVSELAATSWPTWE